MCSQFFRVVVVILILYVVAIFCAPPNSLQAQTDSGEELEKEADSQESDQISELRDLIQESIRIRKKEFLPLQDELNQENTRISAALYAEQNFLRSLENRDDTTLDKIRAEAEVLRVKLVSLERLEDKLIELQMDPGVAERAIAESKETLNELGSQRTEALRPYQEQMSDLHSKYREQSTEISKRLEDVFKQSSDVGTDGDVKRIERSNLAINISYAQLSTSYRYKAKSSFNITVAFVHTGMPQEKFGLFLDKYPIAMKSSRTITFLVGNSQVQVYCRKEWTVETIGEAIQAVVDLETLEALNPASQPDDESEESAEKESPSGDDEQGSNLN